MKRKVFAPLGEAKKADGDQEVGEGNEAIGCSMQPNQAGYPQAHGVGHEVCVEDLIEKRRHKFTSSAVGDASVRRQTQDN